MSELTPKNLKKLNSKRGLKLFLKEKDMTPSKALRILNYEAKLKKLQEELIKLQQWVEDEGEKLVVIFEGRDAAGKGGAIRRAIENLNLKNQNREYETKLFSSYDLIGNSKNISSIRDQIEKISFCMDGS